MIKEEKKIKPSPELTKALNIILPGEQKKDNGLSKKQITHELKTCPDVFCDMLIGPKDFEFRKNDRNFKQGDLVKFLEYDPILKNYSGRFFKVKIKYIIYGGKYGIPEGYCIFNFTSILTLKELKG